METPMPTRNINLTSQLDRFMERQISSGRYSNASEIVRDALRLLEDQDHERQAKLKALRPIAPSQMARERIRSAVARSEAGCEAKKPSAWLDHARSGRRVLVSQVSQPGPLAETARGQISGVAGRARLS